MLQFTDRQGVTVALNPDQISEVATNPTGTCSIIMASGAVYEPPFAADVVLRGLKALRRNFGILILPAE